MGDLSTAHRSVHAIQGFLVVASWHFGFMLWWMWDIIPALVRSLVFSWPVGCILDEARVSDKSSTKVRSTWDLSSSGFLVHDTQQ